MTGATPAQKYSQAIVTTARTPARTKQTMTEALPHGFSLPPQMTSKGQRPSGK
jgi:hypothetical protein